MLLIEPRCFVGAWTPLISKGFSWIMSVYLQPSICFIVNNLKLWNKEYRMELIRHFPSWNILTREWISSATDLMFLYLEVPVWNIHLWSESPEPCFGCPYSQLTKERIIHQITLRRFDVPLYGGSGLKHPPVERISWALFWMSLFSADKGKDNSSNHTKKIWCSFIWRFRFETSTCGANLLSLVLDVLILSWQRKG